MTEDQVEEAVAHNWPKTRPRLTSDQQRIFDEWYDYHLSEMLPKYGGGVERFNHTYPLRAASQARRTLEIGGGIGTHLKYEDLKGQDEYVVVELRPEFANQIQTEFSSVRVITSDCQQRMDFEDGHFDRIVAIHVLEHLDNCPAAVEEFYRLLAPTGTLSVVLPCEHGLLTRVGRIFTTKRVFEKRYGVPYQSFVDYEHINPPRDVIDLLRKFFDVVHVQWYPFRIPSIHLNLVVGLTFRPKPRP